MQPGQPLSGKQVALCYLAKPTVCKGEGDIMFLGIIKGSSNFHRKSAAQTREEGEIVNPRLRMDPCYNMTGSINTE